MIDAWMLSAPLARCEPSFVGVQSCCLLDYTIVVCFVRRVILVEYVSSIRPNLVSFGLFDCE